MRVVLVASGTRGDVGPMISVAEALRDLGHTPLLLGSPPFVRAAGERGIQWREIGWDHQRLIADSTKLKPQEVGAYMKRHRTEQTAAEIEAVLEQAADVDAIVASGMPLGAQTAAEYLDVPYRFLALAPTYFRSAAWGDPLAEMLFPTKGSVTRRLSWTLGRLLGRAVANDANLHRALLGLQPYGDAMDAIFDRAGRPILAVHEQLATIPVDMKEHIVRCAAIRQPDAGNLTPATEEYLAAGDPPIFVGFGSMTVKPKELECVSAAVEKTGRRAIFAGSDWDGIELPTGSLRCTGEPHAQLFSRVAAVVSHGGAGTVAQAFWGGAPQVVLAFGGDQPYWGRATVQAGVAPATFSLRKVDRTALSLAIEEAVTGDYAEQARAFAAEAASTDGAADVAAEVLRGIAR